MCGRRSRYLQKTCKNLKIFEESTRICMLLQKKLVERYKANILTCTRQFAYSAQNHNTIDWERHMALYLNTIVTKES